MERTGQKQIVPTGEAARYLRQLADELERGELALDGEPVLVEDAVQIKTSARPREGRLKIELRVPLTPIRGTAGEAPQSSFKRLKKQMKRDFRLLRAAVRGGSVPVERVRSFHADCRRMVGVPGKGEPHYGRFDQIASAMLQAAEAGDTAGLRRILDEMAALRDEAHDRYR